MNNLNMELQEHLKIAPLLEIANNELAILYANDLLPGDISICFTVNTMNQRRNVTNGLFKNKLMKTKPYLTFSHNSMKSSSDIYKILNTFLSSDIMKNVKLPDNLSIK